MRVLKQESGLSIVQVLMLAAIISIMAAGIASLITNQGKQIQEIRGQLSKDSLGNIVEKIIGEPATLRQSSTLGGNANFTACVGLSAAVCNIPAFAGVIGTIGGATEFSLYSSDGIQVSGRNPNYVYYDKSGIRCGVLAAPTAQCPIRVRTYYIAICAGNFAAPYAASCNPGASTPPYKIGIIYYIEQPLKVTGSAQLKTICNDPSNALCVSNPARPLVISQVPLPGAATSLAGRLSVWNSTTELGVSSIAANDAANSQACNAANSGMIEYAGGIFYVCTQTGGGNTTTHPYAWNRMGGGGTQLPILPNMYQCPVSVIPAGAAMTAPCIANPNPGCNGQIQRLPICKDSGCGATACTAL